MSLFRRNDVPLIFVLLRVFHEELEPLKKMIVDNGGTVRFSDTKMPIIFTQACNYSKLIWPERNKTLVYDIQFIKDCVRRRKIVDPERYRLSEMPLYAECLMTHFLYGGCNCLGPGTASAAAVRAPTAKNRQTVAQNQSQTSSVAEEDFFTATSELSERGARIANSTGNVEDPLASSASLNRSVKRERSSSGDRLSLDCTTTVNIGINVLSSNQSSDGSNRSTIDESQTEVTRPATTLRPTELSCGDDRLAEAVDENEKRPCSVEYHAQVEPKLRLVAQRKKDMEASLGLTSKKRQQRTPTTLTNGRGAPNVVPAPGNTSAILEEVTRSAPSCENEGMDVGVKSEPQSAPPSPANSEASTIMAQTSADSRKRLHSETVANKTPPESNWIMADDLQEQDDVNHPVSKYMRCEDGLRRLLNDSQQSSPPRSAKPSSRSMPHRSSIAAKTKSSVVLNTFSKSYQERLKSPSGKKPASANVEDVEKSKYFETPKLACTSSTSDDSDNEHILITRVPNRSGKNNAMSVMSSDSEKENSSSKVSLNDQDWNKPGPSGTKNHSAARVDIFSSDDSSQDEQRDGSELRERDRSSESCRSQNARNGKKITNNRKDSANGGHLARLRVRSRSDLESLISADGEAVDSISTKTRDKIKRINKPVEPNGKSARTVRREPSVDSSDGVSDESSYNATVVAAKNKRTREATTKSTSGRSGASNNRTNRRKISDDNDSTPLVRKTRARNGITLSPPMEIMIVDTDSDEGNASSRPETIPPPEKSGKSNKHPTKASNRRKDTCVSSASESDSSASTHPLHNADISTKLSIAREKAESREHQSGYRTWYSDSDRRTMILYIVDKNAISLCKGEAFFQVMASEKSFRHRSAQSLYMEFRKILRKIDEYATLFNLSASTVMQFKRLRGDYR